MGLKLLKALVSRHLVIMLTFFLFTGLLTASISSNNYVTNTAWAQTKNSNVAELNPISITSGFSSDDDICDFESETSFSSDVLSEKFRDEFCDEDTELRESDDEIDDQFREAENDDEIDNLDTRERFQAKLQELKDRFEEVLSEEEEEDQPLPQEEQKEVEEQDQLAIKKHKAENDKDCRGGNVLEGASNAADLKVLSQCQEAVGEVVHTKKMNDGDYKFLLHVEDKYNYLLNEKNNEKTDGYLVIEIVPPDQNLKDIVLPDSGDRVHVWGAWVTDKPKGWHEIHPAWKVVKE